MSFESMEQNRGEGSASPTTKLASPSTRNNLAGPRLRLRSHHGLQLLESEEVGAQIRRLKIKGDQNIEPVKMKCHEKVGVEGGKLRLDSFGIELDIPHGAIDSKAQKDIYLSVLTDTSNHGNTEDEMSICFGVQCSGPDDLVLKLPMTCTIPHSFVFTDNSNVKPVLYTGEGKYEPYAVVKERIMLSRSGTPGCIITKDELKLTMNHFSWVKIMLQVKNFFCVWGKEKMCCRPFREKNLDPRTTPIMLHLHLYDNIKGNREMVEKKERKDKFVPAHMEQEVLIKVAERDLKMTCYANKTVIGEPIVVSLEKLMGGLMICEHFALYLPKPYESVLVSHKVGQNENLEVRLLFRLDFSARHRRETASPQIQEQLQGAFSSRKQRTSQGSTGETRENTGRQEAFDNELTTVARKVGRRHEIDNLGKALGFEPEDIQRYVDTNMKYAEVSYMGTLSMLRAWRKEQTKDTERKALKGVLEKAGQKHLAHELFSTS